MAFALALQSIHDLPEGHGQTIFTATTAIVVLTVGNSCYKAMVFTVDITNPLCFKFEEPRLTTTFIISCHLVNNVPGVTDWRFNWYHA